MRKSSKVAFGFKAGRSLLLWKRRRFWGRIDEIKRYSMQYIPNSNIKLDLNEQFQAACNLMENTRQNVFITGKAGTGKSTILSYFRNHTKKETVVLAPTGVAAINIQGQTIHSFFKFKPNITLSKVKRLYNNKSGKLNIYEKIDTIIIDEISMVRADLLDCVDKFLRLNGKDIEKPFGGIQMIFIGDLYQLPPVVSGNEKSIFKGDYNSEYFFDAKIFDKSLFGCSFEMEFLELEKIYRQKDQAFIDILNTIRNNTVSANELEVLNKRFSPNFKHSLDDYYIYLTTTNKMAAGINNDRLNGVKKQNFTFRGTLSGDFDKKYLPTDIELNLKVGAQVMLLNNDTRERWVNGSIGIIKDIIDDETDTPSIMVELSTGSTVCVEPYTWTVFHFDYDQKQKSLVSKTVGSFTQYPIKLAWAITIHKSQGKTFDKVIIDIRNGTFAHGQMYVALSRCTSLDGIVLKKEILKKHILMDWRVTRFITKYQYDLADKKCSLDDKIIIINEAIKNKKTLEIIYLKAKDEKSKRKIKPSFLGELIYLDKKFLGVKAFCLDRGEDRTFRVDRILEIIL
ncbi:MAG: PIF1 helicase [candidate division CPR2 bacterium GW2011_GWC1_39_9]|nr:MAG: PIF1 helicase [candidate division CPR2 bacterium GW2011_GWC1_39_9]